MAIDETPLYIMRDHILPTERHILDGHVCFAFFSRRHITTLSPLRASATLVVTASLWSSNGGATMTSLLPLYGQSVANA
jgi:hypothetical protein